MKKKIADYEVLPFEKSKKEIGCCKNKENFPEVRCNNIRAFIFNCTKVLPFSLSLKIRLIVCMIYFF